MFVEVWNRIKDTLIFAQTDLDSSDIVLTLPEAVPRAAMEYEKFVAIIASRPVTFTQAINPLGEYNEREDLLVFPIDIYSQPITLDYDVRMISNMFTVMDAIVDVFNQRPHLEDSNGRGLRYLNPKSPVILTGGIYNIQPYPSGTVDNRHHFGAVINVPYLWSCPARSI